MNDHGIRIGSDTVRIERVLPGPIERLWHYLTDSDARATWLASGSLDLRDGGDVALTFRNSSLTGHDGTPPPKYAEHAGDSALAGRITACEPPRLLAFTWGDDGDAPSEVRFDLEPRGDAVHLVVTHRRLADREAMLSVSAGWHAHLAILADRLAGRTPEGFWPLHTRLEHEYSARFAPAD